MEAKLASDALRPVRLCCEAALVRLRDGACELLLPRSVASPSTCLSGEPSTTLAPRSSSPLTMKWCTSSALGNSKDAKLKLDELEDGGSGKTKDSASSSNTNGDSGGGGSCIAGGAECNGGTLTRDEDAFLTTTSGRVVTSDG